MLNTTNTIAGNYNLSNNINTLISETSLSTSGSLTTDSTTFPIITYPTTIGTYGYGSYNMSVDVAKYSELSNLDYIIKFSYDDKDYLKNNIVIINNKIITFNCDFTEKEKIQPYELIMKMINEKIKFDISIEIDDILTIKYLGVRFKNIKNNFSFANNKCNFNTLQVKIKYKSVIYDNQKLHITEKRKEKLDKIMEL